MKKIFLIALTLIAFTSCKKETKAETSSSNNEDLEILKGSYVFYDGAAVFQTTTDIYGVYINEKSEELNRYAENYKKEPTDMVLVEIQGKISEEKDEKILWDKKIEITKILAVKADIEEENNVVKLGRE